MFKYFYTFIIIVNITTNSFCQLSEIDSINKIIPYFSFTGGYQLPEGDLLKRYGNNGTAGGNFMLKFRHDILVGVEGNFIFGSKVKENDLFKNISTPDGSIIDGNGIYAETHLFERGFYFAANVGKVFRVLKKYPCSGIMIMASGGFLMHKIRIENPDNTAAQLSGDYKLGYDRMTNGFAAGGFVGYYHLGETRLINYFAGFEYIAAFTKSQRYDFDLMGIDNTSRIDIFYGIKVGWMIPLYKRKRQEFYYN